LSPFSESSALGSEDYDENDDNDDDDDDQRDDKMWLHVDVYIFISRCIM